MLSSHRPQLLATVCVFALAVSGCAAEIARRNGEVVEGRILQENSGQLYVEDKASNRILRVPTEDVVAIDHPGDGLIWAGLITTSLYTPWLLAGWLQLREETPNYADATFTLNSSMGGIAAGLAISGLGYWIKQRSRRRVSSTHREYSERAPGSDVEVAPMVTRDADADASGVGAQVRWRF